MTSDVILSRLRRFLLAFAVLLFGGAVAELWLVKHTGEALQLVAFALCALGAAGALVVLLRARRATVWLLRACAVVVFCGTLLGVYLHVAGNVEFQREIDPDTPAADLWRGALRGGNPLLAPGILSVAALLALAATYRHPALAGRGEESRG